MTTIFETETCSRCGGTGHYSHNGEHSRCYKCENKNGARAYTKRGQAAKEFYLSKLEIRADQVNQGDLITVMGRKLRVLEVRESNIKGKDGKILIDLVGQFHSATVGPESVVRRWPT